MKIKTAFDKIIIFLLLIAAAAVFITGFFTTIYYDMHVDVDYPHYKNETISHLVLSMILVFAFLFLCYRKNILQHSEKLIWIALAFCAFYCLLLILAIKPLPVDDSKLMDDVLLEFEAGQYSSLTGAGGYLYTWPFQLGYFLFGLIMDDVFGHGNYFAWDIILMLSIIATVFLLYKITWELFEDKAICGIMALLSMGMLFFYNYSTFIYGDILSMGPQTAALYCIILFIKREKIKYAIISAPCIALSVLLKTNSEITLIAMVMMLIISSIKEKENENGYFSYEFPHRLIVRIIISIVIVLVVFGSKTAVDGYFCRLTGLREIPGGSPSASHIAMGLQESELEDGWYNGYNYRVFGENNFDTELTEKAAIQNIKERLDFFVNNPRYAIKFFIRKFLTQWADPVCISTHNLDLVSRHVENPTAMMYYIVFGSGSIILRWIMNVFMSVCYLCVIFYLTARIRSKRVSHSEMLLLILIFGGMLFHQFWEGSSRYAMRYYVYWLPYASYGVKMFLDVIVRRFKNAN